MSRPRGSKSSKNDVKAKGSMKKPSSSDAKKSKSINQIIGCVGWKLIPNSRSSDEEGEILSPKSSLSALKRQSDDKRFFFSMAGCNQ